MPQVSVTIAGRRYRMACEDGEENHLADLAHRLDGRIGSLRGQFGEIGDQRITTMAAITIADDLFEAEKRITALRNEIAALNAAGQAQDRRIEAMAGAVAAMMDGVTADIDQVARGLAQTVNGSADPPRAR